jgi:hypothetical protein
VELRKTNKRLKSASGPLRTSRMVRFALGGRPSFTFLNTSLQIIGCHNSMLDYRLGIARNINYMILANHCIMHEWSWMVRRRPSALRHKIQKSGLFVRT